MNMFDIYILLIINKRKGLLKSILFTFQENKRNYNYWLYNVYLLYI